MGGTPGVPDDELGYRGPFEVRKDEDKEDVEEQRRLSEANETALDRRRGRLARNGGGFGSKWRGFTSMTMLTIHRLAPSSGATRHVRFVVRPSS